VLGRNSTVSNLHSRNLCWKLKLCSWELHAVSRHLCRGKIGRLLEGIRLGDLDTRRRAVGIKIKKIHMYVCAGYQVSMPPRRLA
jgi:hypothetical protein